MNEKWVVRSILDLQKGSGGTTDYNALTNKPQINSVTLAGNKSLDNIGAASVENLDKKMDKVEDSLPMKLGRDENGLYMET